MNKEKLDGIKGRERARKGVIYTSADKKPSSSNKTEMKARSGENWKLLQCLLTPFSLCFFFFSSGETFYFFLSFRWKNHWNATKPCLRSPDRYDRYALQTFYLYEDLSSVITDISNTAAIAWEVIIKKWTECFVPVEKQSRWLVTGVFIGWQFLLVSHILNDIQQLLGEKHNEINK